MDANAQSATKPHLSVLAEGKALARQGRRGHAKECFALVLDAQPNHTEALLWLAALADDPEQSIRYLNRVLEIDPQNAAARRGLGWARKREGRRPQAQQPEHERTEWLDVLLLSSVLLVCVVACVILMVVAWQVPQAIALAYGPTPTTSPTMNVLIPMRFSAVRRVEGDI